MDKRFRLTKEQRELVKDYNKAVKAMLNGGVKCVHRSYEELYVYNGTQVQDDYFNDDCPVGAVVLNVDDMVSVECPFGLELWNSDSCIACEMKD